MQRGAGGLRLVVQGWVIATGLSMLSNDSWGVPCRIVLGGEWDTCCLDPCSQKCRAWKKGSPGTFEYQGRSWFSACDSDECVVMEAVHGVHMLGLHCTIGQWSPEFLL